MSKAKSKKSWRERLTNLLIFSLILVGVGCLAYPYVSDALVTAFDELLIHNYQREAQRKNEDELEQARKKMKAYNQKLADENIVPNEDAFTDETNTNKKNTSLNFFQNHTIAVVSIPTINVSLPVFDRTTDLFLERGAGLLAGSSMPTGGVGQHSVIIGHRALTTAKLFGDLPELKVSDKFFIEVNNETLAYQIDQIKTIKPTEVEYLLPEADKDLVTLMTCTPYMVNSHRLLVRGHRIPYEAAEAVQKNPPIQKVWYLLAAVLGSIMLLILIFLIRRKKKQKEPGD